MNKIKSLWVALALGTFFGAHHLARATNPIITDQFTADPTARVFEGKMYLYPSHDIPWAPGRGRSNWFVMQDYHVFSSENLNDWTDHGVLIDQTNVPWLTQKSFNMWAPDCVFKNGKYYFYFPTGGRIGVATADKPYGPFTPLAQPIQGARGIDPCVLIDKDGSSYLYSAQGRIFVSKLKDDMTSLDGRQIAITNLPTKGLIEGPFTFERNGIYYLTYPHANTNAERLEYSTSTNPMGPFTPGGVIMDESPDGCWTVHHSIVEYKGQWYLFYHERDLSPDFDKNRSVRIEYLTFNPDGSIQKVTPTYRGVGIQDARSLIQIDRYSAISPKGVNVSYLDPKNTFGGWKIALAGKDTWVRFDRVDFGSKKVKTVDVRSFSAKGGTVEIHLDKADGPLLATVKVKKGADWQMVNTKVKHAPSGVHNLVVTQGKDNEVELDWVKFE